MMLPALPPFAWPRPARRHAILGLLIVVCSGIELVLLAADAGLIGHRGWRMLGLQNGAFWAGLLRDWQPNYPAQPWAMFCTYAFLHAGFVHLLGNMLALFWIAPTLIRKLGQRRFALLWLVSALGGAMGFALLSNTPAPMVGASGAIFGLLGGIVAIDYLNRGRLGAVFGMTALLAVLNLVMLVAERGAMAWETHLGGYLTGILVTGWLVGRTQKNIA